MVCLTACAEYPELAGFCWTPADSQALERGVCSSTPSDAAPRPPADAAAGPPGRGPAPPADGPAPAGPDGSAGGVSVKFCNRLRRNNAAVELTLEIAGQVRLQATTDSCAPPPGQPCPGVPAGEVPVRLLEGTTVLVEETLNLQAGEAYYVTAEIDPGDNMVFFQADTFPTGASCSATDPLTLPRARARPGKPAQRSARGQGFTYPAGG